MIEAFRSRAALTSPRAHLSPKELAIITGITQGMRNKEIAYQLGTTGQVIKNYLRKVYDKLGVSDRLELALYLLHDEHRVSTTRRFPEPWTAFHATNSDLAPPRFFFNNVCRCERAPGHQPHPARVVSIR